MKPVFRMAAVGALALTLAACGNDTGSTPAGQNFVNGKTFTMVLGADPGTLDPHFTSLSAALQVDRFLYDSLVNIDEKGAMVAGLAEKWQATPTSATYTLRKNVTCSDGTPLTATDIAANISFVGDPKNASSRIGIYVPPGATAVGDNVAGTVTVTSPSPDPFLDRNVGGLQIVCAKGMASRDQLKQGANGTGMFTVTENVAGDHVTLTRRADYNWGPGDWKKDVVGLPDKVVIRIVGNEATAANLLLQGEVNTASVLGPDRVRLQAAKLFTRDQLQPLGELWFNHKAGEPGSDEAVRKALTQALDLAQLGQVATSGNGKPATGLVAPGGPCGQDTVTGNLPTHNVDAAKSALDGAGWAAGADGTRSKGGQKLSISLYYPPSVGPGMQAAAELAQTAWKAVGADVTLKAVTDAEVGTTIVGGQGSWSAALLPLGTTLPTQLVPFLSGPTPPNGVNFSGITNQGYTDNVAAASAIQGAGGCDKWAAAEKALFEHVDMVPFVNSAVTIFAKNTVFELSQGSVTPGSIRMLG